MNFEQTIARVALFTDNGRIDWMALERDGIHPSVVYAAAAAVGDRRLARLAKAAGFRSELRKVRIRNIRDNH